jgi:TolB-like protein
MLLDLKSLKEELEFQAKLDRSAARSTSEALPASGQSQRVATDKTPSGTSEIKTAVSMITATSSVQYVVTSIKSHKLTAIVALLIFATAAAGPWWYSHLRNTAVAIDSIAVLPFANAAQDPNAEYLSDGITESLINRLSLLSNLKVMSSSSVFRYKGKEQDAQKVGNELNVRAVLTGSVKHIGDQLVITVRLDDAQNNQHIWGEQYVRKFADILAVQNEIAQEVSTSLRLKLTRADEQQLAKRYTENVEAYQLYLRGRFYLNKRNEESLKRGVAYFQQAIDKDPQYALAYSGLADSYSTLGSVGVSALPPKEAMVKMKLAAQKALELDDTLAEAHTSYQQEPWVRLLFRTPVRSGH